MVSSLEADLNRQAEPFACVMEEPYDNPANCLHHELLKKRKKEGIGVILTGAGGDEVLAGYEASFWPAAYREWRTSAGGHWPAEWYEFCRRFRTMEEAKITLRNYCKAVLRLAGAVKIGQGQKGLDASRRSFIEERRYHVTTALLPYYLRSTDHYTMNIPLEHRFPFLDYRLMEFGIRLPPQYLFQNGFTKYILRKAMEPFLPPEIVWRRQKFGFPFAYADYFSGRGREWGVYLRRASAIRPKNDDRGYDALAGRDPLLLWRLLSTGAWLLAVEDQ